MTEQTVDDLIALEIAKCELESLGHRVVYDRATGQSLNICGCHVDPTLLDKHGYQVRLQGQKKKVIGTRREAG